LKVEWPYLFIREDFWRGSPVNTLAEANQDLQAWLTLAAVSLDGTSRQMIREQPTLLALPPPRVT